MKKARIFLALVLAIAIFPISVFAAEKTTLHYIADDFDTDYWAYEQIDDFLAADIIDGSVTYEDDYPIVTINPEGKITRAQFTKMIVNALNLQLKGTAETFNDVAANEWYAPFVAIANSHGIIKGVNGNFNPKDNITREQMALMIYRAFDETITFKEVTKTFTDVKAGTEAAEAISKSAANGIVSGYGDLYKPKNLATRAQGITMIRRALHQESSELPTDEQLTSVVTDVLTKEKEALVSQEYEKLTALYNQYGTGYFRVASIESIQAYEYFKNSGQAIAFQPVGEFTVEVVSKSNRFATVKVNNLIYDITVPNAGTERIDMSGSVSMKKDADGTWKIYNVIINE